MRYGKFLQKGSTIGINAPSFSCDGYPYLFQGKKAISNFEELGFNIITSKSTFQNSTDNILKSANSKTKAEEFMEQYLNPNIDFIISMSGGEIMNKTIEHIDFEKIKKAEPKFFCGYSDNTWLAFLLPTICDVAAIYSYNFANFGRDKLHKSHQKFIDIASNKTKIQESFDFIEIEDLAKIKDGNPKAPLNDIVANEWKSLDNREHNLEGRILGGCLDIIQLIIGTKYDHFKEFENKYRNDGIILYFESCDLNILSQLRAYHQIKNAGWFNNCKGILIGRPLNRDAMFDTSYEEILHDCFDELNIPVIYDVDIGHIPPLFSIVNGSYSKIKFANKKGTIETLFI